MRGPIEEHNFETSGLLPLTGVDWNNENHKRIVAASLVQGVYVLEGDRQAGREGSRSLAPRWWEFFHFKLNKNDKLVDKDGTIFGAIFQYSPPALSKHLSTDKAPLFVIAFRGTLLEPGSIQRDLKLIAQISINRLHQNKRFEVGMKAVWATATAEGGSNVWLAGHSLGAAIAVLTGKTMAIKENKFLEAFLFNPPCISIPHFGIKFENYVRQGIRYTRTGILSVISAVNHVLSTGIENEDTFAALTGWIPHLFVNEQDFICRGYIGHFNHRKKLADIGLRPIARATGRISLTNFTTTTVLGMLGKKDEATSQPMHLLPSANLTVNPSPSQGFLQPHKLCQWWRHDLNMNGRVYRYAYSHIESPNRVVL